MVLKKPTFVSELYGFGYDGICLCVLGVVVHNQGIRLVRIEHVQVVPGQQLKRVPSRRVRVHFVVYQGPRPHQQTREGH